MSWIETKAEADRRWQAAARERAQEIGPIPRCEDRSIRDDCALDFGSFCKAYGPEAFPLPWSPNHLKAIERIEAAILDGGQFAFAMPRGSGKSSLSRFAVIWAILYGHRRYVVFVTATESLALKQLKSVKAELRFNANLLRDFPEVCYPIRCLGGEARRASGQKCLGVPTDIEWNSDRLVTASVVVKDADYGPEVICRTDGLYTFPSSGAILEGIGITGDIRGRFHTLQTGEIIRPDLTIVDDPQTRESAKSPKQIEDRESTICGDVAYLAGPTTPIAMMIPCTVIYDNDLASKLLDRKLHPEFQGERTKMVDRFPSAEKSWETYADLLRADWETGDNKHQTATAFYVEHRAEMDAGAKVSWPERYGPHEVSAIQSAMNLKIKDETSFFAECQNEPIGGRLDSIELPSEDEIASKVNGVKRGVVPSDCGTVTAFIDVSQKVLWWGVCGWAQNFTGAVVDYGAFPPQKTQYFTLSSVGRTLQQAAAAALGGSPGIEASLRFAIESLCEDILGREWKNEDGTPMRVDRCLIDANWQVSAEVVYAYCRRSKFAPILFPSHGYGRGAKDRALCDTTTKPAAGERRGLNWKITPSKYGGGRRVIFDSNYWKSHLFNRFATPIGDPGSLALFEAKPAAHRMYAEQVTAEFATRVRAKGREVDEWALLPGRKDEHFLDVTSGCCVAASIQGVALPGQRVAPAAVKRKSRQRVRDLMA